MADNTRIYNIKKSDFGKISIPLARETVIIVESTELTNPEWKNEEESTVDTGTVGELLTLTAKCEDMDEEAEVLFKIFYEGADTKNDNPIAKLQAQNKEGIAEAVWTSTDVRKQGDATELKYIFTVTSDKAEEVESGIISIKNWIQIDNLSKSKKLVLVFEDGTEKTITWENKDKKIKYEQQGNVAVFCDKNAYEDYDGKISFSLYKDEHLKMNQEYMVVNWVLRNEIKENYYVNTVSEAWGKSKKPMEWEKSKKPMEWDFFQKAIKIRNLKTNTLENIRDVNNLTEHTILITPILAESGKITRIINQEILNDRRSFKGNFENGIKSGSNVYSKNYGWIDRKHAGFTTSIKKLKQLYTDILKANKGGTVEYIMESGGLWKGNKISRVTMQVTINKDIKDEVEAQRITLSIFKRTSREAENAQNWTDGITKSSNAEEDLPSNILNFYFEVMGDSEKKIGDICKCFSKEQSLWIYHHYKFVKNYSFEPDLRYPGAKSPTQFDAIKEIEEGPETWTGKSKISPIVIQ